MRWNIYFYEEHSSNLDLLENQMKQRTTWYLFDSRILSAGGSKFQPFLAG